MATTPRALLAADERAAAVEAKMATLNVSAGAAPPKRPSEFVDDVPELVSDPTLAGVPLQTASSGADDAKVPITIVTGYLGSGKSHLLNWVATQRKKKIAIILNEFGDTADIERALTVRNGESVFEEWLELDNGCLCCTAKDNGVAAIERLMDRKGKFDYILLETTGIADPAPIIHMFWLDEGLGSTVYLDGVVTVMDASNITKSLDDVVPASQEGGREDGSAEIGPPVSTAHLQIALADVLLLNKTDLVAPEQLETAKARVRGINAIAPIYTTTYGNVDLERILDLRAYDAKGDANGGAPGTTSGAVSAGAASANVDAADDAATRQKGIHDGRIATVSLRFGSTNPTQEEAIEGWLQTILWENEVHGTPVEVHRVKGKFVNLHTGAVRIIQGVREVYEIVETEATADTRSDSAGKLVFIGKGLDRATLEASFKKALNGV